MIFDYDKFLTLEKYEEAQEFIISDFRIVHSYIIAVDVREIHRESSFKDRKNSIPANQREYCASTPCENAVN